MEFVTNEKGLIPVVIQDIQGEVLMLAYMNEEALEKTKETGYTHLFSRSRNCIVARDGTNEERQRVLEIRTDCDYDTLLIVVEQMGKGACHEGHWSCFHNSVLRGSSFVVDKAREKEEGESLTTGLESLFALVESRRESPKEGSYTNYLLSKGLDKILKKIGEESSEVIIASKGEDKEEVIAEVADLLYHLMVLFVEKKIHPREIWEELKKRR